jgi:hypothetical protein
MIEMPNFCVNSMHRFLREPLLHFLLVGAIIFAVYNVMQADRPVPAPSKEIRVSLDEFAQLALLFQAQWRREPTTDELGRLVENRVQEEVLYREALAMGLDKNDTIVKRRMAQKLQFLAEDVGGARDPTTADLMAWYENNAGLFVQPGRFSLRHLYFSPDRRGERARGDAVNALAKLAGQPQDSELAATFADPFMYQDCYRDRAPEFLGKEFGPRFVQAIAKLAPGSWAGPIESGFGWHLVYIDTVIPGRVPLFEEVESDVRTTWLNEQKERAWRKSYSDMRAKYKILLPAPPTESMASGGVAAAGKQGSAALREESR